MFLVKINGGGVSDSVRMQMESYEFQFHTIERQNGRTCVSRYGTPEETKVKF